jgi:hypothetical protein
MILAERQQLSLLEEFQRNAETRRRMKFEIEDERLFFERRDDERHEEKEREDMELPARAAQIADFRERLDHYDAAIVDALTDNRKALDDVSGKLDEMRTQAFALPDGRRLFKTEDGKQVFDENGIELKADSFDPDLISGAHPTWNAWKAQLEAKGHLEQDRAKLLEFQTKVDKARQESGKDGISKKELDGFGAALEKDMPDIVKQKLGLGDDTRAPASPTMSENAPSHRGMIQPDTVHCPR